MEPATDAVNFSLVEGWLTECNSLHKACKPTPRALVKALRVIDCENRQVVEAPPECSFVALSYVWGRLPQSSHILDLLAIDCLPRTIRDSIEVTIKLGYRFLWIDKFVGLKAAADVTKYLHAQCIDGADVADKHEQIQQACRSPEDVEGLH
jgi:hypothetical protein